MENANGSRFFFDPSVARDVHMSNADVRPIGYSLVIIGVVVLGYVLTVDVFAPVPTFTFDSQYLRVVLFLGGLLSLSFGIALATRSDSANQRPPESA